MPDIKRQLTEVSKNDPCIHCGKGDWCYRFANEATVCNRQNIAPGWEDSGKTDKNGAAILYPQEWQKKPPTPKAISTTEWVYKDRNGDDFVKVIRQDLDNGKKKIFQNYWNGKRWLQKRPTHISRPDIPVYNYQQIGEAIRCKMPIFIVEGEKCADKLLSMGLVATTNIQGAKSFNHSDLKDLEGADRVILCPDRDRPGLALMKNWEAGLKKMGIIPEWLYCYPQGNWASIPDDNGLDLFDWIKECEITEAEIFEAIGQIPDQGKKVEVKTSTPLREPRQYDDQGQDDDDPTPLREPRQYDDQGQDDDDPTPSEPKYPAHVRATREIYGDGHYIALDGILYGFNGTHYEQLDPGEESRKFMVWAEANPVFNSKTEKWVYEYMTPAFLEKSWKWVMAVFAINPDRVNPPGINLKNGVLRISFKGKQATWKLEPHTPNDYFLYCSDVEYNPDADPEMAHRLLEALDPDPREVFLRTVAASLDLAYVRKILGRGVRAALCRGSGANGKDSMKEAIALIFGEQQVASATLGDFVGYDQGRKFDLAQLRGVKFNWPSENNQKNTLDKSESMNAAITGDRGLVYELKGKQGIHFICNAVHFFNCNQLPNLKGGLDSLKTRFCVLDFFKTYTSNPDPTRGELQADPRFKYDRDFMVKEVCPALLNLVLAELPLLLAEGINYDAIESSLQDIQEESTHLWEFCHDYNISPIPDGRIYVHELWIKLQTWYEENGTLERVDKPDGGFKNIWHDQANKWDTNVTGPNQIFKRFKQLFPKIDKRRETKDPEFKGRFYLHGISLNSASPASLSHSAVVFASPSASLSFTNNDSASLIPSPLKSEEVKQKVNQNGKNGEAETLDIYSGEAGEAKKEKIPQETPQKILTREEATQFKSMAESFKEVLGWDSAKMTEFAKKTVGKSTIGRLTMPEAVLLVESLGSLVANLEKN